MLEMLIKQLAPDLDINMLIGEAKNFAAAFNEIRDTQKRIEEKLDMILATVPEANQLTANQLTANHTGDKSDVSI